MSFGAHARIGEYLRNGIARGGTLFPVVRTAHGLNEIGGVVVGNVLQGVGDAGNHIGLANHGHGEPSSKDELGRKSTKSRAGAGSESNTIAGMATWNSSVSKIVRCALL